MKKLAIYHLAALTAVLLAGCDDVTGIHGNGHIVTDQRPIAEFTEVDAEGNFEIDWRSGAPLCAITVDENLLRYIDVSISGGVLHLRTRERIWTPHHVKVAVSSALLQGARLTGACHFEARQLSGSKFYVHSEGAAHIIVGGNVDELLADTEGAAKLEAANLHTKTAQISAEGASHAEVFATEALRVSIAGAGKVTYEGDPKTIEKHVTGAGSIHRKD